jgi:pilus assembly protein CpaC
MAIKVIHMLMTPARGLRTRIGAALILVFAIGGSTVLWAQSQALPATTLAASPAPAAAPAAAPADDADVGSVRLMVGRSTVVDVGNPVARVSLTSAEVADVMVTSPNQLLINGKTPGTISMFVWPRGGALKRYEVTVVRDLTGLSEQLKQLFPKEQIAVQVTGKNVVLSGSVSHKDMVEKAVNVAAGYVDKRDEVVTLLQLRQDAPSNQVLLRVRFAEVSRNALTELGASWFSSGYKDVLGRVGTQQFGNSLPDFEEDRLVFSDFLNLFLFDTKNNLGAVIKALQTKGQFQSLAEPNLVSESGKEASFLAGGEIPIPVAQGNGANMAISVMFKEFGIRLTFTPTVNGDRVHLKVKPEVSTLDFGNAVVLNGFRIPALSTRRTETELELQDRQTFAIAGLMSNTVSNTMQKIPGIGDIPILGLLFRSKAAQKNQTELVVMITPEILPNNSRGVTDRLPRTPEEYLAPLPQNKTVEPPAGAFTPGRMTTTSTSTGADATPASSAPATVALNVTAKPLTAAEKKKTERDRVAAEKRAAEENKRAAEQAEKDRKAAEKAAEKDRELQEKLAKEQLKRDREQAKKEAEAAKKAQEQAKKAQEQARKQSARNKQDPDKEVDEAAARLKAAEAAYQSALANASR